jgi:hypothetical protein
VPAHWPTLEQLKLLEGTLVRAVGIVDVHVLSNSAANAWQSDSEDEYVVEFAICAKNTLLATTTVAVFNR